MKQQVRSVTTICGYVIRVTQSTIAISLAREELTEGSVSSGEYQFHRNLSIRCLINVNGVRGQVDSLLREPDKSGVSSAQHGDSSHPILVVPFARLSKTVGFPC
jgi:hypothetical protein